jgi:hypothetical protein
MLFDQTGKPREATNFTLTRMGCDSHQSVCPSHYTTAVAFTGKPTETIPIKLGENSRL